MIIPSSQLAVEQGVPPSFHGNQLFYMGAIFGLLTMTLLAVNWLWRTGWCFKEDPQPFSSPVTVWRIIKCLIMFTFLLRSTPDVILLLQWPEIGPHTRLTIAETDRFLDGVALIPFSVAWFLEYVGGNLIQFQLRREPPPGIDLWPNRDRLLGPVKIAAGSLAIAFAVVFLQ